MKYDEKNRDPYKGYVHIDLEGDEFEDSARNKHKSHVVKALNIKNYGCLVSTWNRGSASYSSLSIPNVYVQEENGKFILVGEI